MVANRASGSSSSSTSTGRRRRGRIPDKGLCGVRFVCPRCGYEWTSFSTAPVVWCPRCRSAFKNPLHKILRMLDHKPGIDAEIYRMIMTETFMPVDQLIKKGLASKSIYKRLKRMEEKGEIKLVHVGKRIYIPVSELPKIVQTSEIYLENLRKQKKKNTEKKQEENIGQGVQLPAP